MPSNKLTLQVAPALILATLLLAACAPAAAPQPTPATAKPAATAAPAPTVVPPTAPPAKPATTAVPAAKPTAKPEAKPSAKSFDERTIADFFRGKTIKILVGFAPGGAYDVYSRLLSRYMPRHLPGNPNIIVENRPGGSSIVAANATYNTEPKDGTAIGTFNGLLALEEMMGTQGIAFEFTKFNYLGVAATSNGMCLATRGSGFRSLADAKQRELILGASGGASNLSVIPSVLREALGLKMKIVPGYGGTAPIRLAMERDEVHGYCSTWEDLKATAMDRVTAGDYVLLAQVTERPLPDLPNAPMAMEMVPDETSRQLIRFGTILPNRFLYQFALPPSVPAERVQALRAALSNALKDPELLADAQRTNLAIAPVPGQETQQVIADFFQMPAGIKERLKNLLQSS